MLTDEKGSWQHIGLWGSALKARAQQRCLCLKPGTAQNAGRKQDKRSGTHCLSEEWQDNHSLVPGMSLTAPTPLAALSLFPGGDVLAACCAGSGSAGAGSAH